MIIELLIALIAVVVNLLLAGLLLMRGIKSWYSAQFFFVLLIVCIALWSLSLGISESTTNLAASNLFGRATYGFSGFVLYLSYVSVLLLAPRSETYRRRSIKTASVVSLVLLPLFFTGFVYSVPDIESFSYGPGILLYGAYLVIAISLVLWQVHYTRKRGTREQINQVKLMAGGLGALVLLVGLLNVVIPAITGYEGLTSISPLISISYSGIIVYAIARHRLFDIRLVVARSVAYILALVVVGALYGFVAFYLFDRLIFESGSLLSSTQKLVYIALALLSGLMFAPAKRMFDRLSNSIFYRDNYDAQWFIDDLTGQITKHAELRPLLDASTISILNSLKPDKIAFVIRLSDEPGDVYIHTTEKHLPTKAELAEMSVALADITDEIIVTNSHEQLPKRIRSQLRRYDVAVLVRLVSGSKRIGYLALGEKKSGNSYNRRDIEVLDIISNELALAIENALRFDQIQKFNETLRQEIEDATRRLRYSNTKLRALDETKDEFVSMASHQLRTPLTSVKGYLSMVLEGDAGELNPQQKKLLTQAFISSERMNYLISDLLNVSRLKTGKFVMERSRTYLPDIIGGEIGQLKQIAEAKGLELIFDKPDNFPLLNLDETKIRQVIMNFIDNALHYTPTGGKVRVELEASARSVEFRVTDTGLGVPKAEQHKLFGKFYRATNAKNARPDGNGLGLFMAKKVVVGQGGAIIFKSAEGKGSTFGFIFPRDKTEIN